MRAPGVLALATVATLLLVPTAAAGSSETLQLSAAWPASFDEAREEPIVLIPGPPIDEPDRSYGPTAPAASTADTQASFTYRIETPEGDPGPVGRIDMEPTRPVTLDLFLSADVTPEATGLEPAPVTDSQGIAPNITVNATLVVDGQIQDTQQKTKTLESGPGFDDVTRYHFPLTLTEPLLEPGESFEVRFTVTQFQPQGEDLTQPAWNVHTGEDYPTGIGLPLAEPDPGGVEPATVDELPGPAEANPEASLAFAVASTVAIASGGRVIHAYVSDP